MAKTPASTFVSFTVNRSPRLALRLALALIVCLFCATLQPQPARAAAADWEASLDAGWSFRGKGAYDAAEEKFRDALEAAEVESSSKGISRCLEGLARLYYDQGRYAKARPLFERALTTNRQLYGKDSLAVIQSLNSLGRLARHEDRLKDAEKLQKEALELRRENKRTGSPDLSVLIHNLARVYERMDRLEQAEKLFKESIELDDNEMSVAVQYHNLGALYARTGRLDRAEECLLESVRIKEKRSRGPDLRLALGLRTLAQVKAARGDRQGALPLYRKAVKILRASNAPNPEVAARIIKEYNSLLRKVEAKKKRVTSVDSSSKERIAHHEDDARVLSLEAPTWKEMKDETSVAPLHLKPSVIRFLVRAFPEQLGFMSDDPVYLARSRENSEKLTGAYLSYMILSIENGTRPAFIREKDWSKVLRLWQAGKKKEALSFSFHPERGDAQIRGVIRELDKMKAEQDSNEKSSK